MGLFRVLITAQCMGQQQRPPGKWGPHHGLSPGLRSLRIVDSPWPRVWPRAVQSVMAKHLGVPMGEMTPTPQFSKPSQWVGAPWPLNRQMSNFSTLHIFPLLEELSQEALTSQLMNASLALNNFP